MDSFRDEELFVQTQQLEDELGDRDDLYINLEKEITERKCRIVQKKEMIRLLVNQVKMQRKLLEAIINELEREKNENKELCHQKDLRLETIKKAQAARAALETTLCDITNKLSLEKAESKRKKDIYDAAVKDVFDTWESYKEQYNNYPLAKKVKQMEIELKDVEITIKQTHMDIIDFENKKRLKNSIAEVKFHRDMVKLAEKYLRYQKKTEELRDLQKKIAEIKKNITDIKSGKTVDHHTKSSGITGGLNPNKIQPLAQSVKPETVQLTIQGVQMTSPPPPVNKTDSTSKERNFFDWGSTESLELSKKHYDKQKSNLVMSKQSITSTVSNLQSKPLTPAKVVSSFKLSNLLRNLASSQKKYEIDTGCKGRKQQVTQTKVNLGEIPPSKKVCNTTPHGTKHPHTDVIKENTNVVNEKIHQSSMKKAFSIKNVLNNEDKENIKLKMTRSSSDGKSHVSSISVGIEKKPKMAAAQSRAGDKHLSVLPMQGSGNQKEVLDSPRKDGHDREQELQIASANTHHEQQKSYEEFFQNTNIEYENQQTENIPSSPAPDLIPVETSNQPLSQEYYSQESLDNLNLSGESDFVSPADCDEATKAVYARLESEAPYMMGHAMRTQKQLTKDSVVRSQYFNDSSILTTPPGLAPDAKASVHQPSTKQLFSPPLVGLQYGNNSQYIPSPPPADSSTDGGSGPVGSAFASSLFNTGLSNKSIFDLI